MKTHYLILFFNALFLAAASQTNGQMQQIDQLVRKIRSGIGSYRKVEKINNDTASKIVYFKDKDVQLVFITCIENAIQKTVKWTYHEGALIYCEQVWMKENNAEEDELRVEKNPKLAICHEQPEQDSLGRIVTAPVASVKKNYVTCIDHQQFYLQDDHLVAWIKNSNPIPESNTEFKEMDERLMEFGKKFKSTL